jgi:heme oxygenase
MRERTRALHDEAERSGIIARMIDGTVDRAHYLRYLQNLLPVYRSLETALLQRREERAIAPVVRIELFRTQALERDIAALGGSAGAPILPASDRLSARINALAQADGGAGVLAHVYARYLGDLNGGRILARRLQQTLDLGESALNFYRFPELDHPGRFARAYRASIDRAGEELDDAAHVVEEAAVAFLLNIEIARDVLQ